MSVLYDGGFDTTEIGSLSVVLSGTAGSGPAPIPDGTYCHRDLSSVMGSGKYTAIAAAVKTMLDAVAVNPGSFTVTYSTSTNRYTVSNPDAFVLTWTGDAGTRLRKILGYSGTTASGTSAVGDLAPYYSLVPAIAGRSKFSDVYVPDETQREASADDDSTFMVGKERGSDAMDPDDQIMWCDWQQAMEPLAAVLMRSAASSAPWTWEHFFKTLGGQHPFVVLDGAASTVHTLRESGAAFTAAVRQRVVADYDGLWSMNLQTRQLGSL
jgi:hypothetical protein